MQKPKGRKADFLLIGAQKAGTSAMNYYLGNHPSILTAREKELHFFDNDEYFSTMPDYSLFEKSFFHHQGYYIYGESTPIYIYWKPCIKRIQEYHADIKLIALLRDPVARAYSQWNMEVERKNEKREFFKCIADELDILRDKPDYQHRIYSYYSRGLYLRQLTRIKKFFPDSQLLILKYEDFLTNQEYILKKCFRFLGVDEAYAYDKKQIVFKTEYIKPLARDLRKRIIEFYLEEIELLEKHLNWDCSDWKELN